MPGEMGVDVAGEDTKADSSSSPPPPTGETKMRLDSESTDDGLENLMPLELDDLRRYDTLEDR